LILKGLSIPILTALTDQGELDETSQVRLAQWVGQEGQGGQVLFSAGTTGEWNHLPPAMTRRVNEVCLQASGGGVLWAGITAVTMSDTLENLRHAIQLKAPAAVLAPLSIDDGPEPVELFHRHLMPEMERLGAQIPVCLYDNADIAARQGEQHLRTRDVKQLSRLDFVFGVKVSAGAQVVGNYLKAARHFKQRHEFGVYLGNANLVFSVFAPAHGLSGFFRETWNRFALRRELPSGVVAGPANLFPREWQRAWRACLAGEEALMAGYAGCFERLSKAWRFEGASKAVACMKAALKEEGILASDRVAPGTKVLDADQRRLWMESYRQIKQDLATISPHGWNSRQA
jgi:dihydrodipicolinate synthase/N-acetylneuraminate lyase